MEQQDLADRVRGVLQIPLHRFVGLELIRADEPAAGVTFVVVEQTLNNGGILHGGIVTALLDVASYLAVLPTLEGGANAVTHDVFASLLRPVQPGERVDVSAMVLRRGRSTAFLRAEAHASERLVAAGSVTKTVVPAPPAE